MIFLFKFGYYHSNKQHFISLKHYIVFSAIFFQVDYVRLKFFITVYSQVANLSSSAGDNCFRSASTDARVLVTWYLLVTAMTNRKYQLRSGRQPRLQASSQSMRNPRELSVVDSRHLSSESLKHELIVLLKASLNPLLSEIC